MAMTALAAPFVPSMTYRAEQIVQMMKETSMPDVLIRKSLRRPTFSTRKQAPTAVMKLKI